MNNNTNNDQLNSQVMEGVLQFDTTSLDQYIGSGEQRTPVAIRMDGSEISFFKLDDGSIVSKQRATQLAEAGVIQGYVIGHSKLGEDYLRGLPDGKDNNNLQELPKF